MKAYHNIPAAGLVGRRDPAALWQCYKLPESLTGKVVLDIGAYCGGFCVEAVRRNAAEVTAIDRFVDVPEGFDLEKVETQLLYPPRQLIKHVREQCGWFDICDHDIQQPFREQYYDLVLFLQVFYHLFNPVVGFINALRCCKPGGLLVIETLTSRSNTVPALYWLGREGSTDFWMPSARLIETLCHSFGCGYKQVWSEGSQRKCWHVTVPDELRYNSLGLTASKAGNHPLLSYAYDYV